MNELLEFLKFQSQICNSFIIFNSKIVQRSVAKVQNMKKKNLSGNVLPNLIIQDNFNQTRSKFSITQIDGFQKILTQLVILLQYELFILELMINFE